MYNVVGTVAQSQSGTVLVLKKEVRKIGFFVRMRNPVVGFSTLQM